MLTVGTTAPSPASIEIFDDRPSLFSRQHAKLLGQHILHLRPHGRVGFAQLAETFSYGVGIIGLSREEFP